MKLQQELLRSYNQLSLHQIFLEIKFTSFLESAMFKYYAGFSWKLRHLFQSSLRCLKKSY